MSETHFNESLSLTNIVYNNVDLDKVYFNNTLVFEKSHKTTETNLPLKYSASAGSQYSQPSFTFFKSYNIELSYTPKKVLAISGGLSRATWVITNDLSGTTSQPCDATTASSSNGGSFTTLNWSIVGNTLTISGGSLSLSGNYALSAYFDITYEY